jgi:hypothetical protein
MSDIPAHLPEKVCSPVHRCCPSLPTVCLICKATDVSKCPFRIPKTNVTLRSLNQGDSDGNYRNLRGDVVHDGDVFT